MGETRTIKELRRVLGGIESYLAKYGQSPPMAMVPVNIFADTLRPLIVELESLRARIGAMEQQRGQLGA